MVSGLCLFWARARSGREAGDIQALSGKRFDRRGETQCDGNQSRPPPLLQALLVTLVVRCFQLVVVMGRQRTFN